MLTKSGMIHTIKSASPGSHGTPPELIHLRIRSDPGRPEELIPQHGAGTITKSDLVRHPTGRDQQVTTRHTDSLVTDSRIFIYALCRTGRQHRSCPSPHTMETRPMQSAGTQAYISVSSGWEAAKHNTQTGTALILHKNQS